MGYLLGGLGDGFFNYNLQTKIFQSRQAPFSFYLFACRWDAIGNIWGFRQKDQFFNRGLNFCQRDRNTKIMADNIKHSVDLRNRDN